MTEFVLQKTSAPTKTIGAFPSMMDAAVYMADKKLFGFSIQPLTPYYATEEEELKAEVESVIYMSANGGRNENGRLIFSPKATHISTPAIIDRDIARLLTVLKQEYPVAFSDTKSWRNTLIKVVREIFNTNNVKVGLVTARTAIEAFTDKEIPSA